VAAKIPNAAAIMMTTIVSMDIAGLLSVFRCHHGASCRRDFDLDQNGGAAANVRNACVELAGSAIVFHRSNVNVGRPNHTER
jgi:hypothetical protein